jgi:hypothetical protein
MKIRFSKLLFLFAVLTVVLSCSDHEPTEKDIKKRALEIAQRLDGKAINVFKEWSFFQRGGLNYWCKLVGDSVVYKCNLGLYNDTTILRVYEPNRFKQDFPLNFSFDTTHYYVLWLSKYNNEIKIKGADDYNVNHLLANKLNYHTLFKSTDPFVKFSALNSLTDSLGIYESSYIIRRGNFIEFKMDYNHVLTYLPDNLSLNPICEAVYKSEFAAGVMIKKNWNLRKIKTGSSN